MKKQVIILFLAFLGFSCSYVSNKNSINVEVSAGVNKSKIKIEHGISAITINRNTDQFIFNDRSGYNKVYYKENSKKIINEYGENDFLITYKDSLYFEFRQFKTNWHNQHSYNFVITKENSSYFLEALIEGQNELMFKVPMNTIKDAFKFNCNKLRNNYYLNPKQCFENIRNFKYDPTEFVTMDGKFFRKKNDNSKYILTCDIDGHMYLRKMEFEFDIESAKKIGKFWIDKQYVYGSYETTDGEMPFKIEGADVKTFQNLGNSVYGKDSSFIFDIRHGKIEIADLRTFQPLYINGENTTSYGKDKNKYFFWDEIVEDSVQFKQQFEMK